MNHENGVEIDENRYKLFLEMDKKGFISIKDLNNPKSLDVYLKVFNTARTLISEKPILGINIFKPELPPPNLAPLFDG